MKCPYCGTNLKIDDAKCPFCGQDNPYAKKHRQDMRYFKNKFNQTKSTVLEESKEVNANMVKIVTICIFAVIFIVFLFLRMNPYSVSRFFREMEIQTNLSEHRERLDQYEAERDYVSLGKYFGEYSLYYSDDLDEYKRVVNVASYYSSIFKSAMELYNYEQLEEEDTYVKNKDSLIRSIADELDVMYRYAKPGEFDDPIMYEEPHLSCIQDCVKATEEMLQVYFALTVEQVESLESLSPARRAVLIEEALIENE